MSMTRAQREDLYGPLCTECDETQENCECEDGFHAPEPKHLGAWMICPTCSGEGKHSRHLGSYTASEFEEAFDDEESRFMYFSGGYDRTCYTCQGTGKVRENDEEALERERSEREQERINETGYNDAGEFVRYPDWHRGPRM